MVKTGIVPIILDFQPLRYSPFVRALRRQIVGRPALFFPLAKLAGNKQLLDGDTELVVDGFPRSGNSFTEAAFLYSQRSRRLVLKSHAHSPAQVLRAIEQDVATVLLLRDPDQAVASTIASTGVDRPDMHYRDYCAYYRPLLGMDSHFVIAPFEVALRSFDTLVAATNAHFGMDLVVPDLDEVFVSGVNDLRDEISLARTGRLANYAKAGPDTKTHRARLEQSDQKDGAAFAQLASRVEAQSLYEQLRACALQSTEPDR